MARGLNPRLSLMVSFPDWVLRSRSQTGSYALVPRLGLTVSFPDWVLRSRSQTGSYGLVSRLGLTVSFPDWVLRSRSQTGSYGLVPRLGLTVSFPDRVLRSCSQSWAQLLKTRTLHSIYMYTVHIIRRQPHLKYKATTRGQPQAKGHKGKRGEVYTE